jgi:hypothetical protein
MARGASPQVGIHQVAVRSIVIDAVACPRTRCTTLGSARAAGQTDAAV